MPCFSPDPRLHANGSGRETNYGRLVSGMPYRYVLHMQQGERGQERKSKTISLLCSCCSLHCVSHRRPAVMPENPGTAGEHPTTHHPDDVTGRPVWS